MTLSDAAATRIVASIIAAITAIAIAAFAAIDGPFVETLELALDDRPITIGRFRLGSLRSVVLPGLAAIATRRPAVRTRCAATEKEAAEFG